VGESLLMALHTSTIGTASLYGTIALLGCLYFADVQHWDGPIGRPFKYIVFCLLALGGLAYLIFQAAEHPALPLGIFALALPICIIITRRTLLRDHDDAVALETLWVALALSSITSIVMWVTWLFFDPQGGNNFWTRENRAEWAQLIDCPEKEAGDMPICHATLLMWGSPGIFGIIAGLLSVVTGMLALAIKKKSAAVKAAGRETVKLKQTESEIAKEQVLQAINMLRGLAYVFLFVISLLYCISRLVGGNMKVTRSLFDLCGMALVGVVVTFVNAVGLDAITLASSPLFQTVHSYLRSNSWVQAALITFGAPAYVAFMLLSALKQLIRRIMCRLDGDSKHKSFTPTGQASLVELLQWDWTQVLLKMCYIGLIIWWGLVFTLPTYMILSLVRTWLVAKGGCPLATGVFFSIGFALFLLPPVPGVAVYLVAAMVLPDDKICGRTFSSDASFGFFLATSYTVVVVYLMKLVAHVAQQKMFGEFLGKYTSVLAMISINSNTMKAIRYILQQPGLTFAKVCVLCGGPDWPTSVLCGILKLSVCETLLGLAPVLLIGPAPITFASALQTRAKLMTDSSLFEAIAEVVTFTATAIAIVTNVGMVAMIDNVLQNQKDKLAAYSDNQAVLEVDRQANAASTAFNSATKMERLNFGMRLLIISATVACTTAGYLQLFLMDKCFEDFQVTQDVQDVLCLSCERAVVKIPGWFSIMLMLYGMLAIKAFKHQGTALAAEQPNKPPVLL